MVLRACVLNRQNPSLQAQLLLIFKLLGPRPWWSRPSHEQFGPTSSTHSVYILLEHFLFQLDRSDPSRSSSPTSGSPEFVLAGFGHESINFDYRHVQFGVTTTDKLSRIGPEFADLFEPARSDYDVWRDKTNCSSQITASWIGHNYCWSDSLCWFQNRSEIICRLCLFWCRSYTEWL